MGFMSWLSSSRRAAARKQIQQGLEVMKANGLFDDDPIKEAHAVEVFSASRFSKTVTNNMNATILAASWLMVFVRASRAPREQLLPFANVGLSLLRIVTAQQSKLTSCEESAIQRAAEALINFVNATSFNLNPPARIPRREAVPIDGPSSIFCIIAEREYIDDKYGPGDWKLVNQSSIEEDGRFYDKLTIRLIKGNEIIIWFDLTASKAKWTDKGNAEALDQFQKTLSKAVNKNKVDAENKTI